MGTSKRTEEIREESMYPPCVVAVAEFSQLPVDVVHKTYLKMLSRGDNCRKNDSSNTGASKDYAASLRFDAMTGASVDPCFNRCEEDNVINAQMLLEELDKLKGDETALSSVTWQDTYNRSANGDTSCSVGTDGDRETTSATNHCDLTKNSTSMLTTTAVIEAVAASSRTEAVLGESVSPESCSNVKESQREGKPETSNFKSISSASFRNGVGDAGQKTEEDFKTRRMLQEKMRALRTENGILKARQICRHCRQRPVELTLLPCGHFCFCEKCGLSFKACPVCKRTILADVRTFVT